MWNLSRKAYLCRHDMSRCWGRPRFVPLCLNVNKMLCWVVTAINKKRKRCKSKSADTAQRNWNLDNAFEIEKECLCLTTGRKDRKMHRVSNVSIYYTRYLMWSRKALLFSWKMFYELLVWEPLRLRLAFIPLAVMAAIKTFKVNF